ncbi:hypothetical protein MJD09_02125 [bacterium]|nr:hypothetical protein [bacterium]
MQYRLSRMTILVLTLLTLGLPYRGNYGEVPNSGQNSPSLEEVVFSIGNYGRYLSNSKVHSLFVRDNSQEPALMILVAYNSAMTKTVRQALGTQRTPLLFSISSLSSKEHDLNASLFQFRQNHRNWFPGAELAKVWLSESEGNRWFPGSILGGYIQQGIILLPEWFNLHQPVTIVYTQNTRTVRFL